jgi:UDP-N-acetylmuramoylalanine--D-glutamate ligase
MTNTNIQTKAKINLDWLRQYSRITVVGMGMSGLGVCRFLSENQFEYSVQDSRKNPSNYEEISRLSEGESAEKGRAKKIIVGGFDEAELLVSDLIILSPGISLETPEIKSAIQIGVAVTGDVDIVVKSISIPIVAITGSNGKSTVTKLTGEICQQAGMNVFVGGNIGVSVMELLNESSHYELAVLELSSFQLETTSQLSALSAVILNISPDHLDRYARRH